MPVYNKYHKVYESFHFVEGLIIPIIDSYVFFSSQAYHTNLR